MANEITVKFNSLSLDDGTYTISKIDFNQSDTLSQHDIPKSHETIIESPRRGVFEISISGDVIGTEYDNLRTNIDALRSALKDGKQKFIMDDDRYIMATLRRFKHTPKILRRMSNWSADFVAGYPYWLAENATSDERTPTSGVGYTLTNGGNAPARCLVEITPTAEMDDDCAVANATNGDGFRFRGTVAADKLLEISNRYNGDNYAVLNAGVDSTADFEGIFLNLEPGANVITFIGTASTSIKITWRDTWEA
jgi:hypothetical protein